jgi:hypothetical protein
MTFMEEMLTHTTNGENSISDEAIKTEIEEYDNNGNKRIEIDGNGKKLNIFMTD